MNNNLLPSASARCKCGRYITIGEEASGVSLIGYECPPCKYRKIDTPNREEYYEQFNRIKF